jgi:hypothetical protein
MGQLNVHCLKRPLFPIGIHSWSYADTRSKIGQEQLVCAWARVGTTDIAQFICLKEMRTDRDLLGIPRFVSIHGHSP